MSRKKKDLSKNYQKKTQYEHIVDVPDTYIGSIEKIEKEVFLLNDDNKIVKKEIEFIPGLQRIFEEILLNAFDHQSRINANCNTIKIDVSPTSVSVWNNGAGIPIQIHSDYKIWIPELIFANLLTSSNYKKGEKRITGGKNGYGAKLSNIFSTKFIVETNDGNNKYVQICSDNMTKIGKPKITSAKTKNTYTKITFYPDFKMFNRDNPITEFSPEMMKYMQKRVYDISACVRKGVSVFWNKQKIKIKDAKDYVKLYVNDNRKIVHEVVNDRWTVAMCLADDGAEDLSFVNGIFTNEGGTHINYVANQIVKEVKKAVAKKAKNVKNKYIRDKIFLFINCLIENPTFNSQSKEKLQTKHTKYGSTCELSTKFLKDVLKTGIKEEVLAFTEFQANKNLNKNDGKKIKNLYGIDNYDKANWAGTKKSNQCMLILTEGLSAKGFAVNGLSKIGRDRYGIFPLRGKLINTRNHTDSKVADNKEITFLKQILGLKQGMIFKSKDDFQQLRYGGIVALTDQDSDGSHIKGLVMNALHTYWDTLVKLGFIHTLATPIIKAFKGKQVIKFYTQSEYEKWKKKHKKGWEIKYYKGLGTHDDKETIECFEEFEQQLVQYYGDDKTDYSMNLAFNDGYVDKTKKTKWSDKRKEWLLNYDPEKIIEQSQKKVTVSEFINRELIHFSNDDTERSIPCVMDGLKPSQRKILYSSIKRNKKDKKEMRVAEFAGYVTYQSKYHHGDSSIVDAVVGMSQTFVGSNNVNYLLPNGNFGSRILGGKDAASARYIKTNINPLVFNIFNTNDELILQYNNEDGIMVEPKYYMPIIPTILVNGTKGVGTGFSSDVCSYRLRDICKALIDKMDGKPFSNLKPYFRGFQGRIVDKGSGKYETYGLYKIVPETNTIHIIELPIGMWTDKYTKFIESKITSQTKKKYISSYENYCTKNTIHYILKLSSDGVKKYSKKDYDFIIKDLNLRKTFSTNNMHLYDEHGIIKKFNTTRDILEYFYNHRKVKYLERKNALIKQSEKQVEKLKAQVMFIRYYNEQRIIVRKKTKQQLEDQLVQYKFPKFGTNSDPTPKYDYLTNMQIISLTNERAQQLENKWKEMQKELDTLKATSIQTMWSNDIKDLIKMNNKYNTVLQNMIDNEKNNITKTRGKSKKKRKTKKSIKLNDI